VPREHFKAATTIAHYLIFLSIITPFSRFYRNNLVLYNDVANDFERSKEEFQIARQVANDVQANFD
ncbi:hypothetical protein QBC32DRAFT_221469, partial [Pseudoneurospora amorphoporcata]